VKHFGPFQENTTSKSATSSAGTNSKATKLGPNKNSKSSPAEQNLKKQLAYNNYSRLSQFVTDLWGQREA